jgi:hypothetical protein
MAVHYPDKHRWILVVVALTVVVVLIIGSVFVVVINERHNKVGVISDSQLSALAGMQLVEGYLGAPLPNSSWVVLDKNCTGFYNHTVSSVYGGIWIASYEFASSKYSTEFYTFWYAHLAYGMHPGPNGNLSNSYVTLYNGSYYGFHYAVEISGSGTNYALAAIGYSGNYFFNIIDIAIPIHNVKGFIHDQIQAMTG